MYFYDDCDQKKRAETNYFVGKSRLFVYFIVSYLSATNSNSNAGLEPSNFKSLSRAGRTSQKLRERHIVRPLIRNSRVPLWALSAP